LRGCSFSPQVSKTSEMSSRSQGALGRLTSEDLVSSGKQEHKIQNLIYDCWLGCMVVYICKAGRINDIRSLYVYIL
jgi:hypothetical protein